MTYTNKKTAFIKDAQRISNLLLALILALAFALPSTFVLNASMAKTARAAEANTNTAQEPSLALQDCISGIQSDLGVKTTTEIYGSSNLTVGDSTSDWLAFDLARAGATDGSSAYLDALKTYVSQAYATDRKLDRSRSTEWDRIAIVVKALGGDPTSFGTDSSGKSIDLVADGTYNWSQTNDLGKQGSNAYIYALTALNATGVKVPSDAKYTVDTLINSLLSYQSQDGGFGLTQGSSGVDLTGMALAALAPYQSDYPVVADAISKGINYLSNAQGADGSFSTDGVVTSESSSMVIIGLCALGIDPQTDSRFVKEYGNAYSALLTYKRADGTFSHNDTDDMSKVEYMATEQAMRALLACCELRGQGDGNVYTSDIALNVASSGASAASSPIPWIIGGILVGVVVVIIAVMVSVRKSHKRKDVEQTDSKESKEANS